MNKYKKRIIACGLIILLLLSSIFIYSSIIVYKDNNSFSIFDVQTFYGIEAYINAFGLYLMYISLILWPIYLAIIIIIINSIINIKKLKKENKDYE